MKKKLSIMLYGISYNDYYRHWGTSDFKWAIHSSEPGLNVKINYRNSIENFKKSIVDFFSKTYDIDIYFSTYNSNYNKNILNDYSELITGNIYPIFSDFKDTNRHPTENTINKNIHILKNIVECLNQNVIYDLVLICRFDVQFIKSFEEYNIDTSTINIFSLLNAGEPNNRWMDDSFYILPFNKLKQFKTVLEINIKQSFHTVYLHKYFDHINFLCSGLAYFHHPIYEKTALISEDNEIIYIIIRGKINDSNLII